MARFTLSGFVPLSDPAVECVASEDLVAALSGKNDLDRLARQAVYVKQRDRRQVGERLVGEVCELWEEIDKLRAADHHLMVLCAEVSRDQARVGPLIDLRCALEGDRESFDARAL